MIVWINGAFGVGKTSVARELVLRWRGAIMIDPETIGFVLARLPPRRSGDFQDLTSWRRWTRRTLALASTVHRRVVVPMTLVRPDYFEEIVGALRARTDLRHFTLTAPRQVILGRLAERGSAGLWGEQQLDRCLASLADPRFAEHVQTEDRSVVEIACAIHASLEG